MKSRLHSVDTVRRPACQRGLSLVELMVSMLLGILLTAGIVSVYVESKRNYAADEELARIQENGRFALTLMKRELMLAGFYGGYLELTGLGAGGLLTGCDTSWALDIDEPAIDFIDNFNGSSLDAVSGTTLPCLDTSEIEPGTDILAIKRTAGDATDNYIERNPTAAKQNQMYLKVEDFGDATSWVYNTASSFPASDPNDTEYWEIYAKMFYIRKYSTTVGDGVPTLCVRELVNNSIQENCLVEGVENMQFAFGLDTDGDNTPNRYSMDPNDLDDAVTARMYLLMRSVGRIYGASEEVDRTRTYQLGSDPNSVTPNDEFLRRIFSTTVQVRNATYPTG